MGACWVGHGAVIAGWPSAHLGGPVSKDRCGPDLTAEISAGMIDEWMPVFQSGSGLPAALAALSVEEVSHEVA